MSDFHGNIFTCVTCEVGFTNSDQQRAHYKSDWHRYNLKRKVADLPAVSAQDFNERVKLQQAQLDSAQSKGSEETFCKLCSKHFSSENSFANHKQSKKHKDLEVQILKKSNEKARSESESEQTEQEQQKPEDIDKLITAKSDRAEKKAAQLEIFVKKHEQLIEQVNEDEMEEGDEGDWEDIADEEDLNDDEAKGIAVNDCLFCSHNAASVEAKCEHMAKVHSFHIPDMEHVFDLKGLVKFLGIKLGAYHVCLWCSSKCYRDLLSVQKHMIDKGHMKMKFEGETLLEYADFYTYGESDDEEDEDEDENEDYQVINESDLESSKNTQLSLSSNRPSIFEDENFELVLPSGAKIGHRSLFRYYKQSFGHRNLELKQRNNMTIKDKYKAIAGNENITYTDMKKQRKDMAFLQRWRSKMSTKLGWSANKLQKHFRRQMIAF